MATTKTGRLSQSTVTKAKAAVKDKKTAPDQAAKGNREVIVTGLAGASSALDTLLGPPKEIAAAIPKGATFIETRDIPIDQIVVMPGNPRKHFEPIALDELAQLIAKDGQLQPGCVRRIRNGEGYELFIGERRFRACMINKMPTYRASVFDCTEAAVVEMRGFENEARQDFNPIERAIWWQQMIEQAGYTQTSLAAKLGKSQGEISNTIRLLKLPPAWQERVISGEIVASDARMLVPWIEVKGALANIEKEYLSCKKHDRDVDFDWLVRNELREMSGKIKGYYSWDPASGRSFHFDLTLTDEQRIALDVRDVPCAGKEVEPRAFNTAGLKKLVEAEEKRLREAEAKKQAKKDKGKAGKKPTEQDLKAKAAHFAKRLNVYRIKWLQKQISAGAESLDESDLICWLLGLSVTSGLSQEQRFKRLSEVATNTGLAGFKGKGYADTGQRWDYVLGLDTKQLFPILRGMFLEWCEDEIEAYHSDADEVAINGIAAILGIDLETQWTVDEDYLNLHTIEQLQELASEWKVTVPSVSKAGIVAALQTAGTTRRLPAPKELVKVNGGGK